MNTHTGLPIQPMDVYSTHWVPFTVAAFCRGRRHMPEAVELARILRVRLELQDKLRNIEKELDATESKVVLAVKAVEARMDREGQS